MADYSGPPKAGRRIAVIPQKAIADGINDAAAGAGSLPECVPTTRIANAVDSVFPASEIL